MEQNTKIWVKRILCAAAALFFLAFGLTVKKSGFCLGDIILESLGIPAWSQGTHNSATFAVFGGLTSFYIFSRTTKNPKQTMQNLVFGSVGLIMVINSVLNML